MRQHSRLYHFEMLRFGGKAEPYQLRGVAISSCGKDTPEGLTNPFMVAGTL
jgi:hypothetical protein